jgi:hypothetical protein
MKWQMKSHVYPWWWLNLIHRLLLVEDCESNPDLDGNSDDNNVILHENKNDETGRMGQAEGHFDISFILNAIVNEESDDYEESESNSDDDHIERNVKVAHFELS